MLFKFEKIGALALGLALTALPAWCEEGQTGATVVARLYKDFAWQTVVGNLDESQESQGEFGPMLAQQNKAVLDRYFDPALSSLFVRDAACAEKLKQICNLDFDPLFVAQDNGASDLEIRPLGSGRVQVNFRFPNSGERIEVEFRTARFGGKWKITDVVYKAMPQLTLRQLLMRKVPGYP